MTAALSIGCDTRPNPGVELGNPNIGLKSLKVTTKDAVYDFVFIDDTSVSVSRTNASGASTVVADYVRAREYLNLEADFEDFQKIELTTVLDANGNVTSGIFKIDGEVISAFFNAETESSTPDQSQNPPPRESLPVPVDPEITPRTDVIPREPFPAGDLEDPQGSATGVFGPIDDSNIPVKYRTPRSDF